ncbi:hypothetical protein NPIL_588091 [Nephila pilipes]|uniref:Uncharacterized protein n=1 Tax=Nephila pilipes TaxID=299642 RepID=A0A8X6UJN8_NEPPI|nr:hypothetical protein NPIL_588091 [Nephila pilipes]
MLHEALSDKKLHSSAENPNYDCVDVGEQGPTISREETSHSENKCAKFMESNEMSGSASRCGNNPYLTANTENNEHK